MTTYSTQLFAGALAAGQTILFTPSSSLVCVVRDIELYGNYATATQVAIAVGTSGPQAYIFFANPLPAGGWLQWQGRSVLAHGQSIIGVAGAAGAEALVSGYLLTA